MPGRWKPRSSVTQVTLASATDSSSCPLPSKIRNPGRMPGKEPGRIPVIAGKVVAIGAGCQPPISIVDRHDLSIRGNADRPSIDRAGSESKALRSPIGTTPQPIVSERATREPSSRLPRNRPGWGGAGADGIKLLTRKVERSGVKAISPQEPSQSMEMVPSSAESVFSSK